MALKPVRMNPHCILESALPPVPPPPPQKKKRHTKRNEEKTTIIEQVRTMLFQAYELRMETEAALLRHISNACCAHPFVFLEKFGFIMFSTEKTKT